MTRGTHPGTWDDGGLTPHGPPSGELATLRRLLGGPAKRLRVVVEAIDALLTACDDLQDPCGVLPCWGANRAELELVLLRHWVGPLAPRLRDIVLAINRLYFYGDDQDPALPRQLGDPTVGAAERRALCVLVTENEFPHVYRLVLAQRLLGLESHAVQWIGGVEDPKAAMAEVNRAFRRMTLSLHPDKTHDADADEFKIVNACRSLLHEMIEGQS